MRTREWYQRKAAAYAHGWRETFGVEPGPDNVALGLSVAIHETSAGDSAVASRNWGAVQKRKLTLAEKSALAEAGFRPQYPRADFIAKARAALDAAVAAGTVKKRDREELYCDSSPGPNGPVWYFIMFWAFETDEDGATLFVKTLAKNRPSCRAVLESSGSSHALAAAMYLKPGYYEGQYQRAAHYERQPDGKWSEIPAETTTSWTGAELNISEYAGALQRLLPEIRAALAGRAPRPTLRRGSFGEDVKFVQRIVGAEPDGKFGPKTEAAVIHYQMSNHLTPDGVVGPKTWAAMESA